MGNMSSQLRQGQKDVWLWQCVEVTPQCAFKKNNCQVLRKWRCMMPGVILLALLICLFSACSKCDNQPCSNQPEETSYAQSETNTKYDFWKVKWDTGNAEEQKQALAWFQETHLRPGMSRTEVEQALGQGLHVAGQGPAYGVDYLMHDRRASLHLWYDGASPEAVLLEFRLIEQRQKTKKEKSKQIP